MHHCVLFGGRGLSRNVLVCRYPPCCLACPQQDTNAVQYRLVRLLTAVHGNVFVVGDPFQCIYTWRFAAPDNLDKVTGVRG